MSGIDTIQFADLARQRSDLSATAARTYQQRHPADRARVRPAHAGLRRRLHWHPARATAVSG